MNVSELIYELEQMPQDAEVSLAMQPNYPMEHQIAGVVHKPETDGDEFEEGSAEAVYLYESGGNGYLSGEATEACGWGR